MCVIVWRDDEREMVVKENDGIAWSSNDMVLCLGRRQNRDEVLWCGEWPRFE
jgi:hypothetical protein